MNTKSNFRWFLKQSIGTAIGLVIAISVAQADTIELSLDAQNRTVFSVNEQPYLSAPSEGLWSLAVNSDDTQAVQWLSAKPSSIRHEVNGTIIRGYLDLAQGRWEMTDSCNPQSNRLRCVRRMEWLGQEELKGVILSIRWQVPQRQTSPFQPGLLYYGNPAGKKNSLVRSSHTNAQEGEFSLFEEHRFSMPFTSLEWQHGGQYKGAALHVIPSPVPRANLPDQWWSLGVEYYANHTELKSLSGPIGYNQKRAVAKLFQKQSAPYAGATMTVKPGDVIEKIYYLEAYDVAREGDGFRRPVHTSIDIFKPISYDDFPTVEDIIESKLRFAESRYYEGDDFAGFNMFDANFRRQIVMGWAGQSDAPGYSFLALSQRLNRPDLVDKAQKSMDFLTTSPFVKEGFQLRFDSDKKQWSHQDQVSQGQAMYMFAKAIEHGRQMEHVDTSLWEGFLLKAAIFHANRVLDSAWYPESTNEAFHVAPLVLAYELFGQQLFKEAAIKAAEHYAKRHLSMREPYWGGTLDATGEDKEGAWAALQAFMAAYQLTGEKKYLDWAQHAGDAVLSYTVVWDIPMPAGRLANLGFKSRGWTSVSPQNQHLDVYGVLTTPWLYQLGELTGNADMKRLAVLMFRSCGQLIDAADSQGEQIQQTNFVQSRLLIDMAGENARPWEFRGGYSEEWTVLWITSHFLTAYALFEEMGVELD
ncbi:hypothetical protein [Echinimonas agarilytica]|uniref:Uncharacterized protein n=1 Tax=Echinimonas agarilytica TaxID=1215918 RepID=A0AA42B725_9GAMM|nr:hypothetical protein [Echinimonas agarilytica]MCM2679390.1 hypothetical protein [Echinimonas agarilytica]